MSKEPSGAGAPEAKITSEMIEAGVIYASSQLSDMPMAFSDTYLRLLVEGILVAANRVQVEHLAQTKKSRYIPQEHVRERRLVI